MTSPPDSPDHAAPDEDADLSGMLSRLAEKGLADYLRDSDLAKRLAQEVADELNIGRGWVTLAFELLAPLIEDRSKKVAGWIACTAAGKLRDQLRRLPFFDRMEAAVITRLAKMEASGRAEKEVERVLAGQASPFEPRFAEALSLDLQAHLKQLQNQETLSAQMAQALDGIRALRNPQPTLMLPLVEQTEGERFVFGARTVDFLGRQDEFAALDRFLEDEHRFCWWLVAGSGGQGKSRLALEFCMWRGVLWRAGFLAHPKDTGFWYEWQPERPTLLVCDYAGTHPEKLHVITVALHRRRDDLEFPVRLLLLERDGDADATWRRTFELYSNDGAAVRQSRHAEQLTLQGLDDDDLWFVVQYFCWKAKRTPPGREETLGSLAAIDPERRPLFAHFLADAVANGHSPRGWGRASLLRDVLRREEEKYWKPAGVTEKDKNLLALATMTGGLPVEKALSLNAGNLLPDADSFDPRRHEAMTGRPADDTLAPLEPDILGEFFVLTHLGQKHKTQRLRDISARSWDHMPLNRVIFLVRAAIDFPHEPALKPLCEPPAVGTEQRRFWAMAVVDLVTAYGTAGRIEDARDLWERLAGLAQAHDEPALRENQAKGAFNLITFYGTAGRIEDARHLWERLADLAQAHDEPALRENQAKGAFNLILAYGNAGRTEEGRALWERLAGLAQTHDEPALREWQAKGAVNLILAYGNAGRIEEGRDLWERLADLAQAHDEPALRENQAMGAVNLITDYGNAGRIEDARDLWERLADLAQAHDEPALREPQARGAFVLRHFAEQAGDAATVQMVDDALAADPALAATLDALLAALGKPGAASSS